MPSSDGATSSGDLESNIGIYWFSRLGALTLLVGFVFFAVWIHKYLDETVRVALCYIAAGALYAAGYFSQKHYPNFAFPVMASGLVLSFFTGFATHFLKPMACFPPEISLAASTVLMLAAAACAVYVAASYRSQTLGGLSLLMGFWVAIFATPLSDTFTPIMLFFLAVMGVGFLLLLDWPRLYAFAIAGVFSCELWWALAGRSPNNPWSEKGLFWAETVFVLSYFIAFLAGEILYRVRRVDSIRPEEDALALVPASGILNTILMIGCATFAFWQTHLYWDVIHYFYWPIGLLLAGQGVYFHRLEKAARLETQMLYVFACCLITLGCTSAFGGMSLSNILALEGLCLFALHRATGMPLLLGLRAILYAIAFLHFNLSAFEMAGDDNNWAALFGGLPAVLFLFAPAILIPLWPLRTKSGEPGGEEHNETIHSHIHAFVAALMLARLFMEHLRPENAYAAWVITIPIGVITSAALPRFPALKTLAALSLVFAQIYFFLLVDKIQSGAIWWLTPASILLSIYYIASAAFSEHYANAEKDMDASRRDAVRGWMILAITLSVIDTQYLINLRLDPPFLYPAAMAISLILLGSAAWLRLESPGLIGLPILCITSVILLFTMVGPDVEASGFFGWTFVGAGLTVSFERLISTHGEKIREWRYVLFRRAKISILLVTLVTIILLGLAHRTPWITRQYETFALTTAALLLFGLGGFCKSSVYRRAGLCVFVLALARVYLVDIAVLDTGFKILAFMALGGALLAVSFLYSKYKEQFQKWV